MERRKFSVYEAIAYGVRSVVDTIRLFFLLEIAIVLMITATIVIAGFINMNAVQQIVSVLQASQKCTSWSCLLLIKSLLVPIFKHNALAFALTLLGLYLIFAGFYAGYHKVMLDFYDNGTSSVSTVFAGFRYLPKIAVTLFLYIAIVLFGLILIFPGIYFLLRFTFFSYFIIDKNAGVLESLQKSWHITHAQTWHIFALALVQMSLVNINGSFLILLWPFMALAYVYAYRQLQD